MVEPNWSLARWRAPGVPDARDREKDHRVAFLAKQEDFDCAMLAEFGMELKTIAGYTHLSIGQVSYRLKKLGIRVKDFRQGRGKYARMVFEHLSNRAARQLITDVREINHAKDGNGN